MGEVGLDGVHARGAAAERGREGRDRCRDVEIDGMKRLVRIEIGAEIEI